MLCFSIQCDKCIASSSSASRVPFEYPQHNSNKEGRVCKARVNDEISIIILIKSSFKKVSIIFWMQGLEDFFPKSLTTFWPHQLFPLLYKRQVLSLLREEHQTNTRLFSFLLRRSFQACYFILCDSTTYTYCKAWIKYSLTIDKNPLSFSNEKVIDHFFIHNM